MVNKNKSPQVGAIQLFFILFLLTIPIVWISLAFTNFNGDLTRVGKLAERDFIWTQGQVGIPAEFVKSAAISDADVLVVGDSFSAGLTWQASLAKHNLKVATLAWSDVGYICENFSQVVRKAGFKGGTVIVETVERAAEQRLSKSVNCTTNQPLTKNTIYQGESSGGIPQISYEINLKGKFLVGLNTIINSLALRANLNFIKFYNQIEKGVHIYDVKDGCKYFSNHLCELGLFYYEDYERPLLTEKTLLDIRSINEKNAGNGLKFIWVVVPNKSSIFHRQVSGEFWKKLSDEKLGPDLYQLMSELKNNSKDIYDPNGSHLSTGGYESMGQSILEWINLKQ